MIVLSECCFERFIIDKWNNARGVSTDCDGQLCQREFSPFEQSVHLFMRVGDTFRAFLAALPEEIISFSIFCVVSSEYVRQPRPVRVVRPLGKSMLLTALDRLPSSRPNRIFLTSSTLSSLSGPEQNPVGHSSAIRVKSILIDIQSGG